MVRRAGSSGTVRHSSAPTESKRPKSRPVSSMRTDGFTGSSETTTTTRKPSVRRTLPTTSTPASVAVTAPKELAAITDPKFQELRRGLETAQGNQPRKAAANALAGWTREHIVDPKKLSAYLSRTDVTAIEKSRTIGQLALETNRSELILGRSHIGGDGKWEHRGENQGDFVNYYQGYAQNSKKDAWCTKFASHAFQRLGMDLKSATGGKTSPFMSGLRLEKWAEEGKSVGRRPRRLVSLNRTLASSQTSGSTVSGKDFSALTKALDAAKPKDRLRAVNDFMAEHGVPRAGDLIVRDKNNDVNGASHTLMVEQYDPKTGILHTIEGNAGDKVAGFSYDLTNPKVAAQMGFLARMGPEQFTSRHPANSSGTTQTVSADDLLGHARSVNAELIELAAKRGWVHSSDPNATSAMLSAGDENAWTPKRRTRTR